MWKREWFPNLPRYSKVHWNSLEHCRKFMDEIAVNSNVVSDRDWRKVSLTLIRHNGGEVIEILFYLISTGTTSQASRVHRIDSSSSLLD